MLKNLLDIKNKTKGYTDKMLSLVDKMNKLHQNGVSIETLFLHLNQYLDLFEKDKNLKENIDNINYINQEKEKQRIQSLQKEGCEKIALFFKNNGFMYTQLSLSGSDLFDVFNKSEQYKGSADKFKQGIHRQEEQIAKITNNFYKHLSYYHLDGDSIMANFSVPVGYQETLKLGIASEFRGFSEESKSNIYKHLYSITKTVGEGFFANEYSVLMICSKFGMANEIEYLIKQGCDINYTAPDGKKAYDIYQPNSMTSNEQTNYIRSLLDGSYKNGFYVVQYEEKRLSNKINQPEKVKNQPKLKL